MTGKQGGRDVDVKKQIEDFGVPKEDVEATHGLLGQVFNGLKKAGLTAAKTVGDWVGIGEVEGVIRIHVTVIEHPGYHKGVVGHLTFQRAVAVEIQNPCTDIIGHLTAVVV